MPHVSVAALQIDIAWQDPDANMQRVAPLIESASDAGARLAVLPEVFATGFSPDLGDLAERPGGPIAQFMADQAAAHGMWVCGSIAVRSDEATRPVNRFTLAGPEGELFHYDKRHLFRYAGEHTTMSQGEEIVTIDIDGVAVTPFVCYDLRFADDFWAVAPQTDAYVVVSNWPAARSRHLRALLIARAIENQAYVVGVNRVGDAQGLEHDGGSVIIDPWGEVVVDAGREAGMIVATVDAAVVRNTRADFPTFADRR